jgi:hypothetical protein
MHEEAPPIPFPEEYFRAVNLQGVLGSIGLYALPRTRAFSGAAKRPSGA